MFNVVAFAYASTSVLGAISGVQFVSNLFWGKVLHNERICAQHVIATALLVAGLCVALAHSSESKQTIYAPEDIVALYNRSYMWFLSCVGVVCVCCEVVYQCLQRRDELVRLANFSVNADIAKEEQSHHTNWPKRYMYSQLVKPLTFAIPSTVVGTQAVIQSKCMAELLRASITAGSWKSLSSIVVATVVFAFILFISLWLVRLQEGLARFEGLVIIPMLQCFWIISACVQGGVFFQESLFMQKDELVSFTAGILILLVGVAVLASANDSAESSSELLAPSKECDGRFMSSGFPLASPMRPSTHSRANNSSRWTLVDFDDKGTEML